MNGEQADNELSQWFSTYGVITAERILGKYNINLAQIDLIVAIKSPTSFYHRLVQVPLRNLLNGIVLQQANDYHVYAQKLFIDYLLSGESAKEEEAQGATTREAIEIERQKLVALGDEFHKIEGNHEYLIGSSQAVLIKITKQFNTELQNAVLSLKNILKSAGFSIEKKSEIRHALNHALIYCDGASGHAEVYKKDFIDKMIETLKCSLTEEIKEKITNHLEAIVQINFDFEDHMSDFINQAQEISRLANSFRNQFFETIIRVVELIKLLPDYKIDSAQDSINREPLYFDKTIGTSS